MACKILVVDDEIDVEPLFRQGLRRELRNGAVEMEFVSDGSAALDRIRRSDAHSFDMVISDLNMPGMSGLELVQVIHHEEPQVKLAVVTAYDDQGTRAQVESVGVEYFFSKPVDFDAIRTCLQPMQG